MIDFVKGSVVHLETDYVVVDVRDIGYRVFTPNPYYFQRTEGPVTLYIHHHVREDAIQLFGFATREEQKLFRKLLEVSGIGPKVALGILAGGKPETIIAAIQQENLAFLTKLPGIGKKTAQRMVLDLKDKLDLSGLPVDGGIFSAESSELQSGHLAWDEAKEALAALGYTSAELDRAWHGIKDTAADEESVDVLMKKALQWLFKG